MARKKNARAKVRAVARSIERAAKKTEKRAGQAFAKAMEDSRKLQTHVPKSEGGAGSSGIGGWVKENPLLTLVAVAAATAVAVAPIAVYAATPDASLTPAQIAQAQRDAQARADQMNGLKIGAGLFAFTALATLVYAVTYEPETAKDRRVAYLKSEIAAQRAGLRHLPPQVGRPYQPISLY